jgi:phage terminase Nu1 subunit (DNA packaging protein)
MKINTTEPGLCRKTQLAEQIGVCRRTINTLISAGMPCIRPSQRLTLFDPIECVTWLKNKYQAAGVSGYTAARNGGNSL